MVVAPGSWSADPIGSDLGNERAQLPACCQSNIVELCASRFCSNLGVDMVQRGNHTPQLCRGIDGVGRFVHQFVCSSILINSMEGLTDRATSAEHHHHPHRWA